MSIKVKNIVKTYGNQRALDNVSFEINSNEVVGFLGPNGAGKSTMMKILTGYLAPNEGEATVAGFDVSTQALEVKKRVGYLPEHNPLYLEMYVREYLAFIARIHRLRNVKNKVNDIINDVGLTIEANKKIGALSKGYRQRVGLAQAIIHDPEVIILDEPTSGLDPNQIIEIRSLIQNLGKEKTVMMSTHIMQEVEAICDRVIIINNGKVVKIDKTNAIRDETNAALTFLVEFEKSINIGDMLKIEGIDKVIKKSGHSYQISTDGLDVRNSIFQWAVKNGISVLTLKKEEKKLEDIFKSITKEGSD